jgi:formylglycine-generating enzyme required for sulfatase activity
MRKGRFSRVPSLAICWTCIAVQEVVELRLPIEWITLEGFPIGQFKLTVEQWSNTNNVKRPMFAKRMQGPSIYATSRQLMF